MYSTNTTFEFHWSLLKENEIHTHTLKLKPSTESFKWICLLNVNIYLHTSFIWNSYFSHLWWGKAQNFIRNDGLKCGFKRNKSQKKNWILHSNWAMSAPFLCSCSILLGSWNFCNSLSQLKHFVPIEILIPKYFWMVGNVWAKCIKCAS